MLKFIDETPLHIFVLFALALGLAPFVPPHLWEKFQMLRAGQLTAPLDWFDVFFHGAPWVLLAVKLARLSKSRPPGP